MRPRLLIVLAALCFSTTGTIQELGPSSANALSVAATRTAIGALALWLITRLSNNASASNPLPRRELVLAGAGMALYAAAFFSAVRMTGIAVGTVVALGSAPLFAGLGSLIMWGEHPRPRWLITTSIAVAGMSLIVITGDDAQVDLAGIAAACVAGAGYALFALSSKSIMNRATSAASAMAAVFGVATVLMSPIFVLVDLSWLASWSGAGMAMWLGVITVAFAYWAYSTGLRSVSPADATALTIVEPAAATLLAAFVLREQPGPLGWIGIAIVIVALSRHAEPQH